MLGFRPNETVSSDHISERPNRKHRLERTAGLNNIKNPQIPREQLHSSCQAGRHDIKMHRHVPGQIVKLFGKSGRPTEPEVNKEVNRPNLQRNKIIKKQGLEIFGQHNRHHLIKHLPVRVLRPKEGYSRKGKIGRRVQVPDRKTDQDYIHYQYSYKTV